MPRRSLTAVVLVPVAAVLLGDAVQGPPPAPPSTRAPVRGVTISTHRSGQDWGTDRIVPTIRDIKSLGADWISTHPYAWIREDGSVRFRDFPSDEPPESLVRPIREAHAQGVKILIKPHLGYWGSPFRWRGEIAFDTQAEWDRFFDQYERWIVKLAAATKDADGFVVATELSLTHRHDKRWRKIIAAVRKVTKAPLTLAANWSDYGKVPFWDAVDVIGIQAYFPVAHSRDAGEEELRKGWRRVMTGVRRFAKEHGKPIVFTELGYTCSFDAAMRPWESKRDAGAEDLQALCMRVALEAVESEPRVLGAFLWKWFPPPLVNGRDFRLATPWMRKAIGSVWKRAAPTTRAGKDR